jgi:uncharacterized membrane protein YvbJ
MALIKCYECGAEISEAAKSCPHCGAPQPRPQSQMEQFMENTPQEPQKPKKAKDWKYYLELIGSIILGIIVAKIIVKVIIPML